jgi:hypothetical protein
MPEFLDIQYFRLRLFSVLHEDDRDFTQVNWKHGMLFGGIPHSFLDAQRNQLPCMRYDLTSPRSMVHAGAMDPAVFKKT